jgi:acyl-CoA synthetase (AMP-forming)/AMP-acid ligase II
MRKIRGETHWNRPLRCYAQRPANLDAMFRETVAASGSRQAVADGSRRVTYLQLDDMVQRLAAGLLAHELRPGERIAVLLGNRLEFVVALLAIARIGAIIVPVGTRLRRPEIEYICSHSGAAAIVHETSLQDQIPAADTLPMLRLRFSVDGTTPHALDYAELLAHGTAVPPCPAVEDDVFGILYTSGTTGRPKGAALTHLGAIHSSIHWLEVLGLSLEDATVLPIPASHVSGLCGVVIPFLYAGGCLILMREFKAKSFLELASGERITHALMVPAMYGLCLLDAGFARYDLSRWKIAVYGGAPMPEATIRKFGEFLPQLQLCNGYGATETTSPTTIMPLGEGVRHADSIGKVVPCGELRVVDDAGRPVAPGAEGEFWIGGPMVVKEYWADEEATRRSFADGYWKSGDIGTIDEQGYVRIKDRKKDMVNRGGYKVYPAEVENVLREHPGILDCAIVGRPDSILTERVVAFVQPRDGSLSAVAVREFCATRMADYKVPDFVVTVDVPLPRNANGKIQKNLLRQMAIELDGAKQ